MSGAPISSWTDIYDITGPAVLTGPDSFINEAAERQIFSEWLIGGSNGPERLKGGKYITDWVIKDTGLTAQNNLPGATRTAPNPQVLADLIQHWRLTEDVMVMNLIVASLNSGGGSLSDRYHQMKNAQRIGEIRLATSMSNKMEADLMAQPDATKQEGEGALATDPAPIFTYVNEYGADGLTVFEAGNESHPDGNGKPAGFTTIQGVDPDLEPWWRCWQIPYADSDIDTTTNNPGGAGIVKALTKAVHVLGYGGLLRGTGATENDARNNPDYAIPVSIWGASLIQTVMQTSQNYFRVHPQDPYYPNPTFAGMPFIPASKMDTAPVYPPTADHVAPAVGAGVNEETAGIPGPRFPIISRKWLKWFFHTQWYFHMWPASRPDLQWDTEIIPVSTLHNRFCRSRRKMAMVYPSDAVIP